MSQLLSVVIEEPPPFHFLFLPLIEMVGIISSLNSL